MRGRAKSGGGHSHAARGSQVRPKRLCGWAWADAPERRLVEVLWLDAGDISGEPWFDPADVTNRLYKTVTVGYVVAESEKAISLVATCNEHHFAHGIVIPMAWVEQVRELS